jgi:hypothetical protein
LVRAAVVVVVAPVIVVDRRVVVDVLPVAAGTAVAAGVAAVVVAAADGCSGAAVFCRCIAANEVMPPSEVRVIAVATPRRTTLELINGAFLLFLGGVRCAGMSSRRPREGLTYLSFV